MNKESLDSKGENAHEQDDPESSEIRSDTEESEGAESNDPDFVLDSNDDSEVLPVRKSSREKHPKEMKDFITYMCLENSSQSILTYHFLRDIVSKGIVNLEYLRTDCMPADILTKGLGSCKHKKFLSDLGIVNLKNGHY
ncbi:hypothetical protein WA026_012747 [Henosepilachna vigintioctopunctata]|uniref:Uncharacterized protein n=1 Tax=Henosepilachna vigintioctopunctata TaxID=420089 RepID=A0AAW1UAW5_9CUCU